MDKVSLGELKEYNANKIEKNNPNAKLKTLINMFHSLDFKDYLTEEEKKTQKKAFYKEIMKTIEEINPSAKNRIKSLLNDRWGWEKEKDNFF